MGDKMKIRPYARLLTMLSEQLISNEAVAIIELIKNSYDADATEVTINFADFKMNQSEQPSSAVIEIKDNGTGMTDQIIRDSWLNPATPYKRHLKDENLAVTSKGRTMQGEKGIGRFAIFKLGKKATIITKAKNQEEIEVVYDFTQYDQEFLKKNNIATELFLDELEIEMSKPFKSTFGPEEHGTLIRIEAITGVWSDKTIKTISEGLSKITPVLVELMQETLSPITDFHLSFLVNGKSFSIIEKDKEDLQNLLDRADIKIQGTFNPNEKKFIYMQNNQPNELSLLEPKVKGLSTYKNFGKPLEDLFSEALRSGPFKFQFYIFNLSVFGNTEKGIIKAHRIYLYRNNIRVYPYGDPNNDWLQIDILRGTQKAGEFLSNDQIIGSVHITYEENKNLIDKTDREGLIESGEAYRDFTVALQVFLQYLRKEVYKKNRDKEKAKAEQDQIKHQSVLSNLQEIDQELGEWVQSKPELNSLKEKLSFTLKLYATEQATVKHRIETTEELAGVGLAVEITSHDILATAANILSNMDDLKHRLNIGVIDLPKDSNILLQKELSSMRGDLSFIRDKLRESQALFSAAKRRRTPINVHDAVSKTQRLYQKTLEKQLINVKVNPIGPPLKVKTSDAVLLQTFINLFDNAVYWLGTVTPPQREIAVYINGFDHTLTFSDNGPGIPKEDIPYIFDSFFSGKGEDGRGLGLYIAKNLLEKHSFTLELIENPNEYKLKGANFIIDFNGENIDG